MHGTRWIWAITLAACSLPAFAACGERGGNGTPRDTTDTAREATATALPPGEDTLLFQITGLVLLVPPKTTPGNLTAVLTPPLPGDSAHAAYLGFEIPANAPYKSRLCDNTDAHDAYVQNMCYVRLSDWKVSTIGSGGVQNKVNFANYDVLNVANGVPPGNRIALTGIANEQKVVFAAGEPLPSCSLGQWTVGGGPPRKLANVVKWRIRQTHNTFKLVFTPVHGGGSETVEFKSGSGRTIALVLANIQPKELAHFPPHPPSTEPAPTPPAEAAHYGAYARVPRVSGTAPTPVIPHFATTNDVCTVEVESPFIPGKKLDWSVGTYACLPATGDEGP